MNKAQEICQFQIRHNIANIYKLYLAGLEDIVLDNRDLIARLKSYVPEEYGQGIDAINSLTESKVKQLRKRILDFGNDAIRNLSEQLNQFEIAFPN